MKSVPWYKAGNRNMRGKKTVALMAGKHVEEILKNFRERELIKALETEAREFL